MNERIETLAKVAGYDMINKAAMRALGFDVEKFAELIVGECISAVENTNDRYRRDYFAQKIKQHFGIEP